MNSDDSSTPDIFEVSGATPNFRTELAAQLAELVPEAVADGKLDIGCSRWKRNSGCAAFSPLRRAPGRTSPSSSVSRCVR
jgi:hypothetical protein